MKTLKKVLFIIALSVGLSSCNDWLDLFPDNAQPADKYWNSKADVEAVVGAGYVKLRESVGTFRIWGEARGTQLQAFTSTEEEVAEANSLQQVEITHTNSHTKWDKVYQIINMANTVLRYAPDVVGLDPSFTVAEKNSYFSEVYFLRSLAYFYLVRTFRDVPYVTEPYVKDSEEYNIPKMAGSEILDSLVSSLKLALPAAKAYYEESDPSNPVYTKGRATKSSIYALLADICLWKGDYAASSAYCDSLFNLNRETLLSKDLWFTSFYPGNTVESIFEVQYTYSRGQTNKFYEMFKTNKNYIASNRTALRLFGAMATIPVNGDIRGLGGSFLADGSLWKYIGLGISQTSPGERSSNQYDQNYIIYRLADIYLIKAEALIMQGPAYYQQAMDLIRVIRERAGIIEGPLSPLETELDMLSFLLDEKGREFYGEGKAWFDLVRVGSRGPLHREYLINEVLTMIPSEKMGIVRSKLTNYGSHYLPYNSTEVQVNKSLKQNDYYRELGFDFER